MIVQNDNELAKYIRQSQIRVKSGVRLILLLLVLIISAYLFDIQWLAKLLSLINSFFSFMTLIEYLTLRRLKKQHR